MSDEIAEMVIDRVEYIRSISNDPELAHAEEKKLWWDVLLMAAVGEDVRVAAEKALQTEGIDFPRWFA